MDDRAGEPERDVFSTTLDEVIEILSEPETLEPIHPGDVLEAADQTPYQIQRLIRSSPRVRVYEALADEGKVVRLFEALDDLGAAELRRSALIGAQLECPMFPRVFSCFEHSGKIYLAAESIEGGSLAEELNADRLKLPQVLSILSQTAFALTRLHESGWVHAGLRPSVIMLGKPLKITDFSEVTSLGEIPARHYHHAGYSPPELLEGGPIDARVDIYAIGAILFQAVNGKPIAETGIELMSWEPPHPVAGLPQILRRCLGDRNTRYAKMEELHRDLLRLTRRIASTIVHTTAAATTIGLEPSRTTNQDAFGYLSGRLVAEEAEQTWTIACVADGMGGMEAGEVASEATVEAVLAQGAAALTKRQGIKPDEQAAEVRRWIQAANDQVCSKLEGLRVKGGSTCACVCLVGNRLAIAHVGDSRIYLVRDQEIKLLSRDHSLPMALVQQGEISIEAVRTHPDRSMVLRSLGDRRPMPAYLVDGLEQMTGSSLMDLHPGDVLILCSDGVWEPLDEKVMLEFVHGQSSNLLATANRFIAATLRQGAPDNATVVLLRVEEGPGPEEF